MLAGLQDIKVSVRAHHVVIKRGGSRMGQMARQLSAVGPPCAVSSSGMISGLSQGIV